MGRDLPKPLPFSFSWAGHPSLQCQLREGFFHNEQGKCFAFHFCIVHLKETVCFTGETVCFTGETVCFTGEN